MFLIRTISKQKEKASPTKPLESITDERPKKPYNHLLV
jgi:hypothetical protein